MSCEWENQYDALKKALENCLTANKQTLPQIECCFRASAQATTTLLTEVAKGGFTDRKCEIKFFKEIKPRFFCEVEYYKLLYHAEIFGGGQNIMLYDFWHRETQRLPKFIAENIRFYQYIKNGNENQDEELFTQCVDCDDTSLHSYHQSKKLVRSSHDHLLAMMLALERYDVYAKCKLLQISQD